MITQIILIWAALGLINMTAAAKMVDQITLLDLIVSVIFSPIVFILMVVYVLSTGCSKIIRKLNEIIIWTKK